MKKIMTLLGLSEDASEEGAIAEITKFKNRAAQAEVFERENGELKEAQIDSDLAKYANRIKPEKKEVVRKQLLANRAATIEILDAMPAEAGTPNKGTQPLHQRQGAKTPETVIGNRTAEDRSAKQRATVEAYKNSHRVDFETAWNACAVADPELFDLNAEEVAN